MTPIDKIVEDLNKSGFASELTALQNFAEQGWSMTAGPHYLDPIEKRSREIDIYAWLQCEDEESGLSFHPTLICDVKKSEKPWVLLHTNGGDRFGSEEMNREMMNLDVSLGSVCTRGRNIKTDAHKIQFEFHSDSVAMENGWLAHGIHEAFKPPTEHSRWYQAALSLCRCIHVYAQGRGTSDSVLTDNVSIMQPVIILDGELFSAKINEEREIEVVPVSFGTIKFQDHTAGLMQHRFYIDVVRLAALPEYLSTYPEKGKRCLRKMLE